MSSASAATISLHPRARLEMARRLGMLQAELGSYVLQMCKQRDFVAAVALDGGRAEILQDYVGVLADATELLSTVPDLMHDLQHGTPSSASVQQVLSNCANVLDRIQLYRRQLTTDENAGPAATVRFAGAACE
ncbi:hypothetical protein [Indioceanicola profundi]|uniref:hypothetical protein n=1 Tax=Indioceanicola profundi TaxID=2220096 RepID=UPI000E6ACEBE|nr:hypothetical protein [Indioceanicola profundi]